jgi:CheY-like chemotaxis protein
LAAWGFEVLEFSSVEGVLAAIAKTAPEEHVWSLAIVDRALAAGNASERSLPGDSNSAMDGFDIVAHIRSISTNLPIVMLASEDRPGDDMLRKAAGVIGYAVRPVSRAKLLFLVSKALGRTDAGPITDQALDGPTQPRRQTPLRILIAEDSSDNQLLMQLYLKSTPHDLVFVEHGQEALDAISSAHFDVVLMDLQMPVMDGLTATRIIREIERKRKMPPITILALTANARPQDAQMSLEAGCNAHLSKPISKRRLLAALEPYATDERVEREEPLEPAIAALVPRYLDARRDEARRLAALLLQADFAKIRHIAHNLKGTGAAYGFPALTILGAAMQDSAETSDAIALGVQIREFDEFVSA